MEELVLFVRSVRLTILLFLLLAAAAVLGTLVPQNLSVEQYSVLYGEFPARVLIAAGVEDLYHSVWFMGLLALLTLNLVACSVHRFPGTWRLIRSPQRPLTDRLGKNLAFGRSYWVKGEPDALLATVREHLAHKRWSLEERRIQEDIHLLGEKGRYGRLGVFVTHLGVVIVLLGGFLTFTLGFKGFMQIVEGETSSMVRDSRARTWRTFDFGIRCEEFTAKFYPDGIPKEYRSNLTFLQDGEAVMNGVLRVNHPLRYQGYVFFQSSYGVSPVMTLEIWSEKAERPRLLELKLGETAPLNQGEGLDVRPLRYEADYQGEGPAVLIAFLRPGMHPVGGWLKRDGPELAVSGWKVNFIDVHERWWTGLQVKRDPGAIFVWVGCGLILAGCYMAFFVPHRRIWVRLAPLHKEVVCTVAASSAKARNLLVDRMQELCDKLEESGCVRLVEGDLEHE